MHTTRQRRGRVIGVGVGLAAVLLSTAAAGAPQASPATTTAADGGRTHTVVMGAVDPALPDPRPRPPASAGRTDRFEYLAYYPAAIQVHRGDTVHFRRDGFHTVTFSRPGTPRSGWIRRDEDEGVSAEGSTAPSDATCGQGTDQPACVLSAGVPFLNSGWQDLRVEIDLPQGTYSYYCMLHAGMEGRLQVVPPTTALPSPARIESTRRAEVAADTAKAAALLAANEKPRAVPADGRVRWTVKAGDITDDGRVAIIRFMPANLEVAPDDEVVFVVPGEAVPKGQAEAPAELHTATFPNDPTAQSFGLLRYLDPTCDTDHPTGGRSGVRGLHAALVAGCPPGATLELLFQPWAWQAPLRARDDAVTTPATVHDSGMLVPWRSSCRTSCDPWTGKRLASSSRARFPAEGTFAYACLVHPEWGMAGAVTVREP